MGIHGLLPQLGPGERISLAKLSTAHYATHSRPLRLAIDISIWLFQIQSGKGGSNPALRTFYYRLIRLLTLNIWPLFVFDGPNKPLFKRNKKVGGPGVRVASVPEFLAKQLLKQFGFPWHVAPGEAEAECALLQREGIVDAVLSEDVDTLMFGSGVTIRNWTSENSSKTPTHVNVYRANETKERSGMDRQGMILVALMSGGDYIPEGIPGCGPKVACDAARAGFAKDLCEIGRKDASGLKIWKERLQHQIRTNEAKYFSRKNTGFTIPDDFPNFEVLGYYTHPCISTPEKLAKFKQELRWDQSIDFDALRSFTADAFDWRCIGGAKKFIRNLAPAMLVRQLRLRLQDDEQPDQDVAEQHEKELIQAIHGKRTHNTVDGELEYRISFIPSTLVPIDLSIEEEDDQFIPAGGGLGDVSDAESETVGAFPNTQAEAEDDTESAPQSPSKKRTMRPYDPDQPEKLWLLRTFLRIGCPLLVEDYEALSKDPKDFLKQRRQAKAAAKADGNIHAPKAKKGKAKAPKDMPENSLMQYARVTKAKQSESGGGVSKEPDVRQKKALQKSFDDGDLASVLNFKLPSTQIPSELLRSTCPPRPSHDGVEALDLAADKSSITQRPNTGSSRPFAAFAQPKEPRSNVQHSAQPNEGRKTPKRNKKRPTPDLSSPAMSQRTLLSYYSPSPRKPKDLAPQLHATQSDSEIVNLISSPAAPISRAGSPTPTNNRFQFVRSTASPPPAKPDFSPAKLPDTITKRRKKEPLRRAQTAPARGVDIEDDEDVLLPLPTPTSQEATPLAQRFRTVDQAGRIRNVVNLLTSSPARSDSNLPDLNDESMEATPRPQKSTEPHDEVEKKIGSWLESTGSNDDLVAGGGFIPTDCFPAFDKENLPSSLPTPPVDEEEFPPLAQRPNTTAKKRLIPGHSPGKAVPPAPSFRPPRRSPRQNTAKKRIQLRESLEGWWKEVDAEQIDLSGDGSGWKKSGGKAKIVSTSTAKGSKTTAKNGGWRKSGVEVLDLTGA